MTQTGYTNAIVDAMLGWLKGLASWVLKLFNLSGGGSPLKFLADNWLKLLILFMVIGVVADIIVWLVRWRPHWIWFHKKRVVINDKNFFARENSAEPVRRRNMTTYKNWVDHEYVVSSTTVKTRRRPEPKPVKRVEPEPEEVLTPVYSEHTDVFSDDLFNVNAKQKFSDMYEDEVFNVSNLPEPQRVKKADKKKTSQKSGKKRDAQPRKKKVRDPLFDLDEE